MNTHNIQKLIDYLKTETEVKFDMTQYIGFEDEKKESHCGAIACIAGHCSLLMHPDILEQEKPDKSTLEDIHDDCHSEARDFLGITEELADELFMGSDSGIQYLDEITKEDAIKALELLKQGKFKLWHDVLNEERMFAAQGWD